jgi:hypothetical protein
MPYKPFNLLTIVHQKRFKNQGFTMKQNTGIDTETYQGYVKLICDDSGRHKDISSFQEIMDFLTHYRFRKSFNWFYNVRFDFESIIKYLDYSDLIKLYHDKQIQYNKYTITYLDKKFFSINDGNNYYYFYDLKNFLDVGLNKASKQFLHDEKLDIVDNKQLNINQQYWKDNYENIVKYCIKDAELTKQLADHFWNIIYKNMEYYPKRPFSKGKISEEYFLDRCYIPTINTFMIKHETDKIITYTCNPIIEMAYNSYYGGRFELLKKGYFDKVYSYDIKSAYPSIIAELIDFSKGGWIKLQQGDKPNQQAYTGFYNCQVECNESFFSPFIQKIGILSIFPNGKFTQILTKQEYDFIEAEFENVTLTVRNGYEFYPKSLIYPFKSEIERLYEWKEREQDPDIKYCVKIFMNALYGKFIQKSGDNNRTGKLFNPIYASLITSQTRIKLLKMGLQSPDSVIMFSTDSVHSTEPLKTPKEPKMGDFAQDFIGEGVYIMSDIYNLWNLNTQKHKSKIRGFALAMEKDIQSDEVMLKDILINMESDKYKYSIFRPYHLGECLLHKKARKIDDLNVFGEVEKSIDVNGDKKRHWFSDFKNGKECLKKQINSIPMKIGV